MHYAATVARVRPWSSHGPLVLAAVVSLVLITTVLLVRRTIETARDGVVRGVASGLVIAGREQLRRPARLSAADLQAFLDEQRAEGLRYVAVLDGRGQVSASAGEARGAQTEPGLHRLGDRVRLVNPLVSPAMPPRGPRRAGWQQGALIYEFEPRIANQLAGDARTLLLAALAATAVVIGLAAWVSHGLRARERLQLELERGRRLAALGEMSAVLSHELRNPLASLKGHAQLLEELIPDPGPLKAKAARVVGESQKLETLTNDLLEFVRTGELHRTTIAPAALVREAADEAGADRVDVVADAAPATWSLDPGRLRQALVNVVRNAVQHSPEGARVTVRVAREGRELVIAVRDRGPGLPPGEEAKIFEPFHTRRVKGVGLGLAIARRVVELHGGTIDARTHAEGGAELRLRLPEAG